MADVIGVISGGITIAALAAQVTSSVAKLKQYWDLIQDAPEEIRYLIEEVEDLSLLLADIEEDQIRNPISSIILDITSASRCLDHCKRGADRLRELVEDLGANLNSSNNLKKKWGSAKVLLRKDKIEKYKTDLERAVRLLSLSHQCYTLLA